MSIKNLWLLGALSAGVMVAAPEQKFQFVSNLPQLNELELQKIVALMEGFNFERPTAANQKLFAKVFDRLTDLFEQYTDSLIIFEQVGKIQDCQQLKETIRAFSNRIQQEPELTNLVKNLVAVFCKDINLLFDKALEKNKSGKALSEAESIALFAEYAPNNIDLVQIGIEHAVWSYGYLKKQLDTKRVLTVDDLAYVLQQLGVAVKLPKKSQDVWNEFIVAIQKGMKDLPQDVRSELIGRVEAFVRKPELELGFRLIASIAKLRQEIVTTKGADQGKLIGYSKLVDQVLAQIQKSQKTVAQSGGNKKASMPAAVILEKLIFKN